GLRVAGNATGHNLIEWPSGDFKEHRGEGQIRVTPPAGVEMLSASGARTAAPDRRRPRDEWGPFGPSPLPTHLPVGGQMTCRFDPAVVRVDGGRFATALTEVTFQGETAWTEASQFHFHVTSDDWQHRQQLLAGILTDFGSPAG